MSYEVKQWIILRKDLNMRKGKMIAQGAHASMAAVLKSINVSQGNQADPVRIDGTADKYLAAWLRGSFAKIALGCNSEEELLRIHAQAEAMGLRCALITDAGKTEFDGVPTHTAVAIGPCSAEDAEPIVGALKLL